MKIKSIRLKNGYKRFHDLTIDLGDSPARIVALVGPNGCGKSSVLDGMLYLQSAHVGRIGKTGNKDYSYHSMHGEANFNFENIELAFEEGSFQTVVARKKIAGNNQTIFSFRSPYRYNSSLKVTATKSTTEIRLNNYGASTASAIDEKMEENYRRLFAKFNKYLDENDCKPSEAKTKIIGDLNTSIEACLDIKISNLGNIEANQGSLYFIKYDQQTPFEFDVLSSGEKEVVDILLDLYLRKEAYDETIFLIDEPELHINTAIQKKLLLEINKLVGENCQIWVVTHSIGLLRALQDDLKDDCQIIHFEPALNFASEALILKPIAKNHHSWREIFETALDDLTGLVSPKEIIYCEGKASPSANGENGLDAKVYNKIFGESYPNTLFVSSGGNTELDQRSDIAILILSKVFTGLNILVLKDRDMASGANTSQNDRTLYLKNNPANHRVLVRWELENYLYDKELLQAYALKHGLNFDESKYDAAVSNIEDDDVKSITGQIKSIVGLVGSVQVDKFKIALAEVVNKEMTVYKELEKCIFMP